MRKKYCRFKRILVRKVLFDLYVHHQRFVNLHTSDMQFVIACCKHSDSSLSQAGVDKTWNMEHPGKSRNIPEREKNNIFL